MCVYLHVYTSTHLYAHLVLSRVPNCVPYCMNVHDASCVAYIRLSHRGLLVLVQDSQRMLDNRARLKG